MNSLDDVNRYPMLFASSISITYKELIMRNECFSVSELLGEIVVLESRQRQNSHD
jgi:hypothetical protein